MQKEKAKCYNLRYSFNTVFNTTDHSYKLLCTLLLHCQVNITCCINTCSSATAKLLIAGKYLHKNYVFSLTAQNCKGL